MSERWLPVVGYEGLYSVSDQGRARSEPRIIGGHHGTTRQWRGGILKTRCPKMRGRKRRYPMVALWQNNIQTSIRLHDLVTTAFIGPKPKGLEVLHWDDDPNNNAITNLRYGTRAENKADQVKNTITCQAGHPWTPENTYIRKDLGTRQCRSCQRIRFGRPPLVFTTE
jgi:hypothetical protein